MMKGFFFSVVKFLFHELSLTTVIEERRPIETLRRCCCEGDGDVVGESCSTADDEEGDGDGDGDNAVDDM